MSGRNYFINGTTELLILFLLSRQDCYVYELTKTISDSSEGLRQNLTNYYILVPFCTQNIYL